MVVDGIRALVVGDYFTPRTGPHAGQLGPWAGIVRRVGVDPRSVGMKVFFVVYGVAWLAVAALFLAGGELSTRSWTWWAMLGLATGSLWYAVVGSIMSGLIIVMLLALAAAP